MSDPNDGFYMLFAPAGTVELQAGTHCAIGLLLNEDDDEIIIAGKDDQLLEMVDDVRTARNVIYLAKEQKPNATIEELIDALNYYADNDAFIFYGD
jgi:hypothetical protein